MKREEKEGKEDENGREERRKLIEIIKMKERGE